MRKQALGKKSCRKDSNLKQEMVRQEQESQAADESHCLMKKQHMWAQVVSWRPASQRANGALEEHDLAALGAQDIILPG